MPTIEMYCTESCPFCQRAEILLTKKGVEFKKIDIESDERLFDEMVKRAGNDSVPQIFINDRHIGGFDDMVELDIDDELDPLLGIS